MIVTGLLGPGPRPVMNTPGTVDLGIDGPRATEEDENATTKTGKAPQRAAGTYVR